MSLGFSGEVDPYLHWGHPLKDSANELNWYYNHEIQVALKKLPENCSCEEAAGDILKHFGVVLNAPLEKKIKSTNWIDKYHPALSPSPHPFKNSIFWNQDSPTFERGQTLALGLMIDETINVGGVFISVDKLTHFMGSGFLYYNRYQSSIDKGYSSDQAMIKAIELGILGEKNILGRYASGVFSFADLEANFQGLIFGLQLCREDNPLLKKAGDRWTMIQSFDIKDYVNPYWNEAFNPSYYYEGQNLTLLKKSTTVLSNLPSYCNQFHSSEIQARFNHYNEIAEKSFSVQFLQGLIPKGEIPDPAPFDIRKICSQSISD